MKKKINLKSSNYNQNYPKWGEFDKIQKQTKMGYIILLI